MIPVNIVNNKLSIKNIDVKDLDGIVKCINKSEDNLKTLAIDGVLSYNDIKQRYIETLMNSLEYFCGIYMDSEIIGMVKGRIENKIQSELWILSMIFFDEYRNKGIGSMVLGLIEKDFNKKYGIRHFCTLVVNKNVKAKKFWNKNGYSLVRTAKVDNDSVDNDMIIFEKIMQN